MEAGISAVALWIMLIKLITYKGKTSLAKWEKKERGNREEYV